MEPEVGSDAQPGPQPQPDAQPQTEFERLKQAYQEKIVEYEKACGEMSRLAKDPAASVEEFRRAAAEMSRLGEELANLRTAISLTIGHGPPEA